MPGKRAARAMIDDGTSLVHSELLSIESAKKLDVNPPLWKFKNKKCEEQTIR